ncbi:MAG: 5'-3' exonuclease H3TH domain-containing protein [Ginsengibacter sp.]
MIVHLIDGTYELFRHFYGQRRFNKGKDKPFGATVGVLNGILQMIEEDATHLGVATDHVIESFRNKLWPGYKTGEGIEPALLAQFTPLEEALGLMGVVLWPMIDLEADDALASAAHLAAADAKVDKVCIWTPDKDLAQCVSEDRIVQIAQRTGEVRNEKAVLKKFGVSPKLIPDFLALVGDNADGYPGISGIGKVSAMRLLNQYGPIEAFPKNVLEGQLKQALLFKHLATLKTDAPLFKDINQLRWLGPTPAFAEFTEKAGELRLLTRAKAAAAKVNQST